MRRAMVTMLLCAWAAASGCNAVGPTALRNGRGAYNLALQQSTNEQLLLNLVRMRYCDTPLFFEVASVTTSFDEQVSLGGSASLARVDPNPVNTYTYGITGNVMVAEHPTICYVPMQSERFAKQMLSPVSADALLLLSHSGWSVRRILMLCVQRLNGLQNAPRASGPTPRWAPEYQEFRRAVELMLTLQLRDALRLETAAQPAGQPRIVVVLDGGPDTAADIAELRKLLRLNPEQTSYPLVEGPWAKSPDVITIETRSVLAAMHYLSQGVEVPKEHAEKGKANRTRDFKTNELFDWQRVLKEVFQVRSQKSRPEDAAVAVNYRDAWFYVDDADLDSKCTFDMLTQLTALQAGDIRSATPVLTIPVSR